jgi:hypothetical protein
MKNFLFLMAFTLLLRMVIMRNLLASILVSIAVLGGCGGGGGGQDGTSTAGDYSGTYSCNYGGADTGSSKVVMTTPNGAFSSCIGSSQQDGQFLCSGSISSTGALTMTFTSNGATVTGQASATGITGSWVNGRNGGSFSCTKALTTPMTTQFPLASVLSAFEQSSQNYTLTAVNGVTTVTVQTSSTPGASATFEGQIASTNLQTVIITANNSTTGKTATSTVTGINYFNASPFKSLGGLNTSTTASNGQGEYIVNTDQVNLPTYATVGQSGSIDTSTTYTDNSKSVVYATDTDTWSLSSDTATTAWACDIDTRTVVGFSPTVSQFCLKIDTTGNVLAMKMIMPINGTIYTFQ